MTTPDETSPVNPEAAPDQAFALEGREAPADIETRAKQLTHRVARGLAAVGPDGWERVDAVFALTVDVEAVYVFFSAGDRSLRAEPPAAVLELVREHRVLSAELGDGPWWRLVMGLTNAGQLDVDYDYGDEPFPDGQTLPPEAYRTDLERYPRQRLPIWLAAYVSHADRQSRPPQQAAVDARADRAALVRPQTADGEVPDLPVLWSRWAVLSAAFVAARSARGPRVLPSVAWFEGATRSGSTLYVLPGGRAVLSGGLWNAPQLSAVYNDGGTMPKFFAGAPDWVANPVLNPRAPSGLMTFCYWWENDRWFRGESPTADMFAAAVPGVWTVGTVADIVTGLVGEQAGAEVREAAGVLVSAAEVGVVTRETMTAVFAADDDRFDIDGAMYELSLAGLLAAVPEQATRDEAVERVREHIAELRLDTTDYPLAQLTAERISVGWMVHVPAPEGEIALGRAVFYLADDGVLERSSSSVAPEVYVTGFEQRFRRRTGSRT